MEKIKVLIVIAIISIGIQSEVFAQISISNSWAVGTGNVGSDQGLDLCSDVQGNYYITGAVQMEDQGNTEILLAKYNKYGELLWQKNSGSDTLLYNEISEYGRSITAVNDFIYVTGVFMATADFSGTKIKSQGVHDIFLAKYSQTGELIWVKRAGGNSQDLVYSISSDAVGDIYITGTFQREAQFDSQIVTAQNSTDMFIAKYSPEGQLMWIRQSSSAIEGVGKKIKCFQDHCIVAGEYQGSVRFNTETVVGGEKKIILTDYDKAGNLVKTWVLFDMGNITVEDFVEKDHALFVTGSFQNEISFDGRKVASIGGSDAFLLKHDLNGGKGWITTEGGPYMDKGNVLIEDYNEEILLVGTFQGSLSSSDSTISGFGADDIFISSFNQNGTLSDIKTLGGPGSDRIGDIELLDNFLVFTGYYRDQTDFGNKILNSRGESDVMLVKLDRENVISKEIEIAVNIFPNPSTGKFFLNAPEEINSISIFNILGQPIEIAKSTKLSARECELQIKNPHKGIFLVKGTAGGKMFVSKVILE